MKHSKKILFLIVTTAMICPICAYAQDQVVTTTSSTPINTPVLLWYPTKNAFRLGEFTNSSYMTQSWAVGDGSFGMGLDVRAGTKSFVFGDNAEVGYGSAFVFGEDAGAHSSAIVMGESANSYWQGVAIGENAYSHGYYSMSVGADSTSSGQNSAAFGYGAISAGSSSLAGGKDAMSIGTSSTAIGHRALSEAFAAIVLGFNNESLRKDGSAIVENLSPPVDPSDMDLFESEPILMVGNATATGEANRSNALTIYRDGDAHFTSTVRVPASGDISMGDFDETPTGVLYVPSP